MHVIARGGLVGGAVGAVLAVLRGRGDAESGVARRYAKSIAEGAVAGAGVGFVLDRRLRARAAALVIDVAERAPGFAEAVAETLVDVAVPRVVDLAGATRDRAEQAYGIARPRVLQLAGAALERAADLRPA